MAQKIRGNFPKTLGPIPYKAIFSGDIPYIPLAQKGLKKWYLHPWQLPKQVRLEKEFEEMDGGVGP
jgi:hypothetical protein